MSHSTYQKNTFANNNSRSIVNRVALKAMQVILLASVLCLIVSTTSAFGQTVTGSQCVRANPTLTIGPNNQSVFQGNQLSFTVTITNNDSAGCPPSTFVTMPTFPEAGFVHKPDCIRSTLSPGQSQTRIALIKVSGAACVGPRTFRETAANESVVGFSGFADAALNVVPIAPDCGRAAPTVIIQSPEQGATSGDQLAYQVTVKNNDNIACGGSSFKVFPTLPDKLTTQTPKEFVLFVPPGGSTSRPLIIRSDLFAFGDLEFMETATHECATCLFGSSPATFAIVSSPVPTYFCCKTVSESRATTVGHPDSGTECTRRIDVFAECDGKLKPLDCPFGYDRNGTSIECH